MLSYVTLASALIAGAAANNMGYGGYVAPAATTPMYEAAVTTPVMMDTSTSTSTSTVIEIASAPMMEESSSMMMSASCTTTPPAVYSATVMAASAAMTHSVIVGGDAGLVYTPSSIIAAVGDIVEFTFMKQNHSVTQSTFLLPCVKMAGGLDSGLMANPNNTVVPAPTWQFTVMVTTPTWWYCKQKTGTHCGKGMTFAVNPTMEKTFGEFMSMAIAQNGTAATTVAAGYTAAAATGSPVTLEPASTTVAAAATSAGMVVGTNSGSGSTCQCECFCGIGAYPQGAGIMAYGGMGGALPAPWASSPASAAPSYAAISASTPVYVAPSASAYVAPVSTGGSGSYGGY